MPLPPKLYMDHIYQLRGQGPPPMLLLGPMYMENTSQQPQLMLQITVLLINMDYILPMGHPLPMALPLNMDYMLNPQPERILTMPLFLPEVMWVLGQQHRQKN